MPKKGQYGVAPYISMSEAIDVIKEFHRQYGERSSKTFLADIVGNTPKSSSFLKKLAALRTYGLLQEANGDVRLSPLALSLAAPTKPNEEQQAKVDAFFCVSLFKKMHEKVKGGLLPKTDTLNNLLSREFSIQHKDANAWSERFEESLHTVQLLRRRGADWMVIDKSEISSAGSSAIPAQEETEGVVEETQPTGGEWREYTHPMGKLRIRMDAPKDVIDEFMNFLKFVILKEKTEG